MLSIVQRVKNVVHSIIIRFPSLDSLLNPLTPEAFRQKRNFFRHFGDFHSTQKLKKAFAT